MDNLPFIHAQHPGHNLGRKDLAFDTGHFQNIQQARRQPPQALGDHRFNPGRQDIPFEVISLHQAAGTVSAARLLESETAAPPDPAAFDRVTVQVDDIPEVKLVCKHDTWVRTVGAAKAIEAVCEPPLSVAVITAVTSWVRLPAPAVAVGSPAAGTASSVWGTRFASPSHGFVFGHGLWETTDGGGHWTLDSTPSGSILWNAAKT